MVVNGAELCKNRDLSEVNKPRLVETPGLLRKFKDGLKETTLDKR